MPGEADFRVRNPPHDAEPSRPVDADSLALYRKAGVVFAAAERAVSASDLPELQHACTLKGYHVIRTDSGWLSRGDWGRKWITLHSAWLTIRPDKKSVAGLRVVPLRDAS
eukprot:gene49772-6198_t